jgi:PAS domain S-box-containing protein
MSAPLPPLPPAALRGTRAHRIVRIGYRIRTAAFAYAFLVVAFMFWERQAGASAYGLAVLLFLAYPHLAYLRARHAREPKRAELQDQYVDSVLLGAWAAGLGFPLWPAYGALVATTLNAAVSRGIPAIAWSLGLFGAGALAWSGVLGFDYRPGTSPLVTALCLFGALGYTSVVGYVVYRQNRGLRAAERNLRVAIHGFNAMAEALRISNASGRIVAANRAYCVLTGYPVAELTGRPEADFEAGPDAEAHQARVRAEVEREGHWSGLAVCRRRDGGTYQEWRRVSAVRDSHGRLTHYLTICFDVGRQGPGRESRP